jgi:hypothetical protein
MAHTFSKSAFYNFGDIPLAGLLPNFFTASGGEGGFDIFQEIRINKND